MIGIAMITAKSPISVRGTKTVTTPATPSTPTADHVVSKPPTGVLQSGRSRSKRPLSATISECRVNPAMNAP